MHLSKHLLALLALCTLSAAPGCGGDDNLAAPYDGSALTDSGQPDSSRSDAATDTGAAPGDAGGDAAQDTSPASDAADAGDAADAVPFPAAHPDLPLVRNPSGGPVLAHPRIVPILYASDDPTMAGDILQLVSKIGGSTYWAAAMSEYGVGPATAGSTVTITDAPPTSITSDQIVTWLQANLDTAATTDGGALDGSSPWPTPDGNTIYAIFYPAGVTVEMTNPQGPPAISCTDFGAYHDEATYVTGSTPFAVIPRCSNYLGHGGMDFIGAALSHEVAEASTDPFVQSNPAYSDVDFAGSGWQLVVGGPEVGDLCKLDPASFYTPSDIGFLVQRTWSNAGAKAGHDPCAPAPTGEPYFNSVPDVTGTEVFPGYYVAGVVVAPGTSTTVDLHLYSDAPTTGPWTLTATEPTVPQLPPDPNNQLSFSFDATQGQNGDVVHLTITRKPAQMGQPTYGLPFQITSTLGTESHSYWGMVGN